VVEFSLHELADFVFVFDPGVLLQLDLPLDLLQRLVDVEGVRLKFVVPYLLAASTFFL
jgi:hypothetical protein